jgi:hypothetical protein
VQSVFRSAGGALGTQPVRVIGMLLFFAGILLASYKVTYDLDAFRKESKRTTDLLAFAVIGVMIVVLALAIGGEIPPAPYVCWAHQPCDAGVV